MIYNVSDKVYAIVKLIPRGKVMTYGQIAELIQNSKVKMQNYGSISSPSRAKSRDNLKFKITPRVVGQILHKNPNPKNIPCHRVVNKDGRAAVGYAFGGATVQKEKLLAEAVGFRDNWHVDLKYLWKNKV